MPSNHTPLPWKNYARNVIGTVEDDVRFVADCRTVDVPSDEERYANAILIVHAVNCHAQLLAALEAADEKFSEMYTSRTGRMPEAVEMVRAAIAKAKGA